MRDCTIRNCEAGDLPAIIGLQERNARRYPGATLIPAEVYPAPAFEDGRNIACALDADGSLVGYAPLDPAPAAGDPRLSRVIWAEIKVDPALTKPDRVWRRLPTKCPSVPVL